MLIFVTMLHCTLKVSFGFPFTRLEDEIICFKSCPSKLYCNVSLFHGVTLAKPTFRVRLTLSRNLLEANILLKHLSLTNISTTP